MESFQRLQESRAASLKCERGEEEVEEDDCHLGGHLGCRVVDPLVGGELLGGRRAGWEVTGVGAGQGGPPPGRAPTGAALQPRLPSLPSGTLNRRGYTSHTGTEGPQETKTLEKYSQSLHVSGNCFDLNSDAYQLINNPNIIASVNYYSKIYLKLRGD